MRLGFALEYSLGHTTHAQNLKCVLNEDPNIVPTYIDLPYHGMTGRWTKLPGVRSNWSLRASLGAYLALRPRAKSLQAVLFHTQVTSLLSVGLMRRLPAVISLDATPIQYDALGAFYGHTPSSNSRVEAFKKKLNLRAFAAARRLVTWSCWTRDSLVCDYGVPAEKIEVISPGIDTNRWCFPRGTSSPNRPVHLLFVGGDFPRKGGDVLLTAFNKIAPHFDVCLHVVTKTEGIGQGLPQVRVYHDLTPNSEGLQQLYRQADLFVFPTRGDCLPLAVMEALAAGLPIVTTAVGALPEAVTHEETGLVVPPDDPEALANAMTRLIIDPALRDRMSLRAREVALERFDAATNYRRLIDVVKQAAG